MNSLCIAALTVISAHGDDIETQYAQAINPFPHSAGIGSY